MALLGRTCWLRRLLKAHQTVVSATLIVASMAAAQPVPTIDGSLSDDFWLAARAQPFIPAEEGVPPETGGEVRIGLCGIHLCLAARLPEEKGKVLARSFGRNPEWERDALESPPVEDRVEYVLQSSSQTLKLAINPWGAYRLERDGKPFSSVQVRAAAIVDAKGWTIEAALPFEELGLAGETRIQAIRIRSRRQLSPELQWFWPTRGSFTTVALKASENAVPDFRPPLLGNTDPPLEVGRLSQLPEMPDYLNPSTPTWSDPAWKTIPTFTLPRNEPYPRAPRYATEVKWAHDGLTLAFLIRATETRPLVANTGGRDSAIDSGDHIAIRLATDAASFLEILVNPVGAIRDRRVRGLHTVRSGGTDWNADIHVRTRVEQGAWIVRLNVPLKHCAEALGATALPAEWRVLISRYRAPRSGEPAEISALPPVGSETLYGPIRYRRMKLRSDPPSQVAKIPVLAQPSGLEALDSRVWTDFNRHRLVVRSMVRAHQQKRVEQAVVEERRAWDSVRSRVDWERFREERLSRLRQSAGEFPAERPSLDVRVSATYRGKGYRLENLVYQSRPGFYVSANLYRPEAYSGLMPAIVIMHSFHYPKTQGELHDMGEMWARTGCAVLIPERLGFGERVETTPWNRQAYASRFTFRQQLGLIGDSFIGWMAWDLIRAVDVLQETPDIDRNRIIMIGAVAGGNEPAAVAAALDERIAAVIPYNYDHGRVRLDADFPGELTGQINMSFVTASVAPRRYVRAFEFGWEGAAEPDYPDLWVDAWERGKKIWELYGAQDNLATIQAYGLIRLSIERVSHCFSVGPQQRAELHPILLRWFGIPMPSAADLAILPDSELSVNPYREEARQQEAKRRRPASELISITPALSSKLPRRLLHQVAKDRGRQLLETARRERGDLRKELEGKLGDIEPRGAGKIEHRWTRDLAEIRVEALALQVEEGIRIPMLVLRPAGSAPVPIVVGITTGGKDRFLTGRGEEIRKLISKGVAVCLPDLRGTGETAPEPDWQNVGSGLSEMELALGNTLLGARLKDLRAVLRYVRSRPEFDPRRVAVWGDGFAPANGPLLLDELELESGPQIQYHSEPMGALLALLGALYEDVPVVAAQRGLGSYISVLDDAFTYTPADAIVHGILRVADVADIAVALAPRLLLLNAPVNGRNEVLTASELETEFAAAREAYRRSGAVVRLRIEAAPVGPADWLASALKP